MQANLPPLNSLKAFAAAAKHLSFTHAAGELFVTQGAISKQIKILESFLGTSLFKRIPGSLLLTNDGKQYLSNITAAFDIITQATSSILKQEQNEQALVINILPSLSTYWLIPHLKDFKYQHPDIKVHVITGDGFSIDFKALGADVAIRGNSKPFDGLINIPLMDEEMKLVSSPSLINQADFQVADITNYTLLEHTCRPYVWHDWLQSIQLQNYTIDNALGNNTLGFEHFFMLIEAAKKGLGFALIPDCLVEADIAQGNLINPLDITYKTDFSYYLLYPDSSKKNKSIQAFQSWLQQSLLPKQLSK
jgi:LysR family transcriptional regulator, glycine cleavage system transcriptional activator